MHSLEASPVDAMVRISAAPAAWEASNERIRPAQIRKIERGNSICVIRCLIPFPTEAGA